MLTITAICIIALAYAALARAGEPQKGKPSRGAAVAELVVATWQCEDKLPRPRTKARSPWKHHSKAYWAAELNTWKLRHRACRAILAERARQWHWEEWLPDKWRRIGVCETGLNWQHQNSSYEGAFGFATSSWDAFKPAGYPDHASQASPWQQYVVALAIYARYGFSGWGCRGA